MNCLNKNSWTANNQFRYSRPRSTGFSSLSDRPWKEKEGWNANRRLLLNSPDPIVPILVQCQSRWMGKSPIPGLCNVLYLLGYGRAFYQRFLIYDSCWSIYSGGGCRAEQTSHSLDREDHQDFVIRCRTYSNSKSSDRIGISIPIRPELSYWIAHWMSILPIMPWRGLEPPRSLARDFESRVSTISPPRHLESESYSMNMISI